MNARGLLIVVVTIALAAGVYWFTEPKAPAPVVVSSPAAAPVATPLGETAAPAATSEATTIPPAHEASVKPTAAPAISREQREFRRVLEATQRKLPTLDALRQLTDQEVHRTPEIIKRAGTEIAKLADQIEANPALKAEGAAFYAKCAERDELATSVRALCLNNWKALGVEGEAPKANEEINALVDSLK